MEKVDQKYFGEWSDYKDLVSAFAVNDYGVNYKNEEPIVATNFPTDAEVSLAIYDVDGYEGSSYVLFERDGQLWENVSSHCSCNGLEWGPEPTTWAALSIRPRKDHNGRAILDHIYGRSGDDLAVIRYWQLVDEAMAKVSNPPDDSTPC